MPNYWEYKCFKDNKGKVAVIEWLQNELSKKAWASLKRSMEILASQPIQNWHKPLPASQGC